ncbi:hypothetical protein [Peribacillus frigoritolerans]|uniref:hypothetical protein n=1 Tax=Peribacillus frigoritolerans TaxID=450367 RepID=UPI00227E9CC5|nr:hypothetical protein [Peribacillus frigoritolerans]MCY9139793.1 hypothetical protein [Peribacillus frigoritolerans]
MIISLSASSSLTNKPSLALFSALANDEEGKQKELDKMRAHVKRLKNEKKK